MSICKSLLTLHPTVRYTIITMDITIITMYNDVTCFG